MSLRTRSRKQCTSRASRSCGIVTWSLSLLYTILYTIPSLRGSQPMSSGNTAAPSPVRAITSTLSTRAAPTVPPASQTYEPLARAVLRRRLLYDILPMSILPVWTSAICWKMWNSGGMSTSGILNTVAIPIHPGTLLMTTIVWVFGVLPLIVLRKSQLTGESINRDL
jgi:nucleoporin NDC1